MSHSNLHYFCNCFGPFVEVKAFLAKLPLEVTNLCTYYLQIHNGSSFPFSQVETVFHEFGHALQHMLTKQDEGLVAGIRGIEWDAVELPSQFMENWCYHR